MSKEEIESLEKEEEILRETLSAVLQRIGDLKIAAYKEKYSVDVGTRIVQTQWGGLRRGQIPKVYVVTHIRMKWEAPALWARLIRKDGTPGTREHQIYGDWKLEDQP